MLYINLKFIQIEAFQIEVMVRADVNEKKEEDSYAVMSGMFRAVTQTCTNTFQSTGSTAQRDMHEP